MVNYTNKLENSTLLGNVKSLTPLNTKRSNTSYLFSFIVNHLIYYPTPITIIYAWSFYVFYCSLFSYFQRVVLRVLYETQRIVVVFQGNFICSNGDNNGFYRLCSAMGSHEFLGSYIKQILQYLFNCIFFNSFTVFKYFSFDIPQIKYCQFLVASVSVFLFYGVSIFWILKFNRFGFQIFFSN